MPVLQERLLRTFRYHAEGEKVKTLLYALLSVLLLFTAAIVSNIEALQQTLHVTLDNAYLQVFVPVEAFIWIRSIAIVLLIVAHAMRHVQIDRVISQVEVTVEPNTQDEELADQIDNQTHQQILILPQAKSDSHSLLRAVKRTPAKRKSPPNYERVRTYMDTHQSASVREVAKALNIGISTANKWMLKVKDEQSKESEQIA